VPAIRGWRELSVGRSGPAGRPSGSADQTALISVFTLSFVPLGHVRFHVRGVQPILNTRARGCRDEPGVEHIQQTRGDNGKVLVIDTREQDPLPFERLA